MAHHIYQTRGIIIKSLNIAEANKLYFVVTRDLGFLNASAQGVRFQKSKLRFSLQPLSLVHLSLVRGRAGWRIVNAQEEVSLYAELRHDDAKLHAASRILSLVVRLVHGEEKNVPLFDDLWNGLMWIACEPLDHAAVALAEGVLVLKVLRHLGYLAPIENLEMFVKESLSRERLEAVIPLRSLMIAEINKSLYETQL